MRSTPLLTLASLYHSMRRLDHATMTTSRPPVRAHPASSVQVARALVTRDPRLLAIDESTPTADGQDTA